MSVMASQITSVFIVWSSVGWGVTDLCAMNSPVTGEFPTQKASGAEYVSIWWRHHVVDSSVYVRTKDTFKKLIQCNNGGNRKYS